MSESLLSLVAESHELIHQLVQNDGEVTPEIESRLTVIDAKLPAKIDAYAMVLERLELEAGYWEEKAKQYKKIADGCFNARERIKEALKNAADSLKTDELKGLDFKFKISNVKPKLMIDQSVLSDDYLTQTVIFKPDNDKIRSELESGKTVVGASLFQSKSIRSYPNRKA